MNSHTHSQLIFDKGVRIYNGEKMVSSASDVEKVGKLYVNQ